MADLEVRRSEGVLWVCLNRPQRKNAVPVPMWAELQGAFEQADQDPEVRVLVVHGAGGNFCAGADLSGSDRRDIDESVQRPTGSPEEQSIRLMRERIAPAALSLHQLRKPSIAMVEGVAAGAGCNLALGCDVVYAAEDARFSQIFIRRALSLDFGGSWILPRLVGAQKARELALFGDFIPAAEAAELGMIARAVPASELKALVEQRAQQLVAQSPAALATIKRVLQESERLSFAEAVDREFVLQGRCLTSDDSKEAVAAFLEKRVPEFR